MNAGYRTIFVFTYKNLFFPIGKSLTGYFTDLRGYIEKEGKKKLKEGKKREKRKRKRTEKYFTLPMREERGRVSKLIVACVNVDLVVLVGNVSNDLKASSVPIVYSMIKATNDDHQAQNKLKRALSCSCINYDGRGSGMEGALCKIVTILADWETWSSIESGGFVEGQGWSTDPLGRFSLPLLEEKLFLFFFFPLPILPSHRGLYWPTWVTRNMLRSITVNRAICPR